MNEKLKIVYRQTNELTPYTRNARTHDTAQVSQIVGSMEEYGWTNPVLIDENGEIIAGHGRVLAAEQLNMREVPTIILIGLTDAQKRAYRLADNRLPFNAGWNNELLALEFTDLLGVGFDLSLTGFSDEEIDALINPLVPETVIDRSGNLAAKFLVPPFSVLNARDGWWQDRKKDWLSIGIQSELGRDSELVFSKTSQPGRVYDEKNRYEAETGRKITWEEFHEACPDVKSLATTSIFDPVLCELVYRWFSPKGGTVVDPFAGGSVRGIVASALDRHYAGCDLRREQVEANRAQWAALENMRGPEPRWICADSRDIVSRLKGVKGDLLFTCPPYADLEVYSDDPADISNMPYDKFLEAFRAIIREGLSLLKQDRFACVVVGEVRDKKGIYRNFVADTISAFIDGGASYYNEAVLVTQAGSLPIRAGKAFSSGRKLGKTHQNVLVFVKGDPKKATSACGIVDVSDAIDAVEATDDI